MNIKNKTYIVITCLTAITLLWLSQSNKNKEADLQLPDDNKAEGNNNSQIVDTLEGVLWLSDDQGKGNLMLANKYAIIYVKTSRDFTNLVGKNVIVTADGTLDNFTLLNIEEHLTKDGFIKTN